VSCRARPAEFVGTGRAAWPRRGRGFDRGRRRGSRADPAAL